MSGNNCSDAVLEKIRKLLRMRRGGTDAEVETALALASELARKHGVDLNQVDPDKEPPKLIGHIDAVTAARIGLEYKYAAIIAGEFFNVDALIRSEGVRVRNGAKVRTLNTWRITLIGTERDTQIATYVMNFLVRHFRDCWATRRGRARNRQAFLHGMMIGLRLTLKARQPQVPESSLVLIGRDKVQRADYMRQVFGDVQPKDFSPDTDAVAASLAGFRAGRETRIPGGLTNPAPVPKQLELLGRAAA